MLETDLKLFVLRLKLAVSDFDQLGGQVIQGLVKILLIAAVGHTRWLCLREVDRAFY